MFTEKGIQTFEIGTTNQLSEIVKTVDILKIKTIQDTGNGKGMTMTIEIKIIQTEAITMITMGIMEAMRKETEIGKITDIETDKH